MGVLGIILGPFGLENFGELLPPQITPPSQVKTSGENDNTSRGGINWDGVFTSSGRLQLSEGTPPPRQM